MRLSDFSCSVLALCLLAVVARAGGHPNDECSSPRSVGEGLHYVATNGATSSPEVWGCAGATGGMDVWLAYTPGSRGRGVVTACPSGNPFPPPPNGYVEVYSGRCGNLASLGCSGGFPCNLGGLGSPGPRVYFEVDAGATYLIRIGGAVFTYEVVIGLELPPDNETCARAVALSPGLNGPFTNDLARMNGPTIGCGHQVDADVWFRHTVRICGEIVVETCNTSTNFDTVLEGFRGTCGSWSETRCNNDACGTLSRVRFREVRPGDELRFRVAGEQGAIGSFELRLTENAAVGSRRTIATGCGADLAASGLPSLGTTVSYAGGDVLWLGFRSSLLPLCGVCTLGADPDVVSSAASLSLALPCDFALTGITYFVQSGEISLFPSGGCPLSPPFVLALSDTLAETIG